MNITFLFDIFAYKKLEGSQFFAPKLYEIRTKGKILTNIPANKSQNYGQSSANILEPLTLIDTFSIRKTGIEEPEFDQNNFSA